MKSLGMRSLIFDPVKRAPYLHKLAHALSQHIDHPNPYYIIIKTCLIFLITFCSAPLPVLPGIMTTDL